jgi:transposase InsO family protein
MYKGKRYTDEEIRILQANPNVKSVRINRLTLTFEFRKKLYEAYKAGQSIRDVLEAGGISCVMIGSECIKHLKYRFRKCGSPTNGRSVSTCMYHHRNTPEEIGELLDSGLFVKSRTGIVFSDRFISKMFVKFPDVDLYEELRQRGLDPVIVGYQRIHHLEQILSGKRSAHRKSSYIPSAVKSLQDNPYVKQITSKLLVLKPAFYQRAYVLDAVHINDILKAFEIDPDWISIQKKYSIKHILDSWKSDSDINTIISGNTVLQLQIERNLNVLLTWQVEQNLTVIHDQFMNDGKMNREAVCHWIRRFTDHGYMSVTAALKRFGISRSNYYAILKNSSYGMAEAVRKEKDDADIELIKDVIAYRGYPKGTRMVSMMMKRLKGVNMGRKKVQRLMRKAGLLCKVRQAKSSRKAARELLDRNCCPNLLNRKFRIARPFQHLLTDVTYLKHRNNETAYLSPIKDAATGMILTHAVSDTQNMELTDQMFMGLDTSNIPMGALFHSDQGALYLTDAFQKKIRKMGMKESMSRRGNCWDNASMESFFGHFKDEVDYKDQNLSGIDYAVFQYVQYYNNERPQWNRNKMTPFECMVQLMNMSDEEFAVYEQKEMTRYRKMKKRSAEKAIQHARDLGCVIPSKVTGRKQHE